ncbi:MAG: tRNA pseudouridine(13) synthase TruD, partial [Planctomycetota bacterium]|nr:tRNA pseudouridine(13) synthase TruD [Planctomycetota bacterium]
MRLKQRVGDFHVRELLNEDFVGKAGDYAVYRVTKKKMTTPEALRVLAGEAGVETGDVAIAGLKDRQGVTIQFMSLPRKHRQVNVNEDGLRIELAGYSDEPVSSAASRGNAFEIAVRALDRRDVAVLRQNLEAVREHGLINYFDDQRFGNLRHDQGWVARELMLGNSEEGLKRMLFWPSPFDSARYERYKGDIGRNWGDWDKCAGISRGFGEHFSIFDHLVKKPDDFGGAFYHAPSRIRLIHLYSYQSHVWNRAAALLVRDATGKEERVVMACDEGALPSYGAEAPAELASRINLRLPGSRLEDCGEDREVFEKVLAAEGLKPEQFHIEGVPGFALKGEDRPLVITPGHLRVRPAEDDHLNHGLSMVRLRFELGRGSYATLVTKRLFEAVGDDAREREEQRRARNEERRADGDFSAPTGGFQRGGYGDRSRNPAGGGQGGGGGFRRERDDRPAAAGGFRSEGGGGYQGGGDRGGRPQGGGGGYRGGGGGGGYQGGGDRGG